MWQRCVLWLAALRWGGAAVSARALEPAACEARFDVQRDKIIRTEESREMGARYLSELDVGARAECLRLCCETDACDVFVFEEKSPGSCYLFKCGPPEDFRCKFTTHGNFSSGVLAVSRRLAELQDEERLPPPPAPHPARPPPDPPRPHSGEASSTSSTSSPSSSARPATAPPSALDTRLAHSRRCSRYQFECASGECIAVYNACDGVPQCADRSDEAPALACPAPPTLAPPPPSPPARAATTAAPMPIETEIEDKMLASGEAGEELWPRRLTQAQPHRRYPPAAGSGRAPHIFSHKGGLLQPEPYEPAPPAPAWPRRAWPAPPREGAEPAEWAPPYWSPERAWPPHRLAAELPQLSEQSVYSGPAGGGAGGAGAAAGGGADTMPELPLEYGAPRDSPRDAPKKGLEVSAALGAAPAPPAPRTAAPPTLPPAPPLDTTTKKKDLKRRKNDEVQNSISSGEHEVHRAAAHVGAGEGERGEVSEAEGAGAALLLLAVGSLLTAALAAGAGCRLRAASSRRRHKRYALDADYLVNGMYL